MANKRKAGSKIDALYQMLGWEQHTKRSLYGHNFMDGKCVDCGLTKAEFDKRWSK